MWRSRNAILAKRKAFVYYVAHTGPTSLAMEDGYPAFARGPHLSHLFTQRQFLN